jgi:hypothetical protein
MFIFKSIIFLKFLLKKKKKIKGICLGSYLISYIYEYYGHSWFIFSALSVSILGFILVIISIFVNNYN